MLVAGDRAVLGSTLTKCRLPVLSGTTIARDPVILTIESVPEGRGSPVDPSGDGLRGGVGVSSASFSVPTACAVLMDLSV